MMATTPPSLTAAQLRAFDEEHHDSLKLGFSHDEFVATLKVLQITKAKPELLKLHELEPLDFALQRKPLPSFDGVMMAATEPKASKTGKLYSLHIEKVILVLSVAFAGMWALGDRHSTPLLVLYYMCFFGLYCAVAVFLFKNISFRILGKLLKQVALWTILCFLVILVVLDITVSNNLAFEILTTLTYVSGVLFLILLDAVMVKSRSMTMAIGIFFILVTVYNVVLTSVFQADAGLFFSVRGHMFSVGQLRRSVFVNVGTLMASGLVTLFQDKEQQRLMFVTSNCYRTTASLSPTSSHFYLD